MQKWKVECRRSSLRRSGRRNLLRGTYSQAGAMRGLWESNTEYSDTSVDHVVQDFFHNVAALESDCGGEESDVRRHLSTLSVTGTGSMFGTDASASRHSPATASGGTARRKPIRQKRKKRRSKRKWLAAAQALNDQHDGLHSKRRKDVSPIARPRRDVDVSETAAVGSRVGCSTFTSSEDESLARLFASNVDDVTGSLLSLSRAGGDEVSSSVCVTESELSDTPWEESCDADDELSCFEAPKLHACYMSAVGRCYGDVEDECETATSDQDKMLTEGRSEAVSTAAVARRPCRRTVQASPRHVAIGGHMMTDAANGLAHINRLLTQFVTGERTSSRYLRLPAMNRSARRIVWRLATLYNLQCCAERTGRGQFLLLSRSSASRVPEPAVLEQLWQRASFSYPIPMVAPVHQSSLSGPMESEEVLEQSDVSDNVSMPPVASQVGTSHC